MYMCVYVVCVRSVCIVISVFMDKRIEKRFSGKHISS